MATVGADFVFVPKVWQDHTSAFFRKKLVYGQFALMDDTLTGQPGETVNFPYFKKIGGAEEPSETDSLTVDRMQDDSFSATIFEAGKALSWKKRAFRKSAANADRIVSEGQSQMARVMAEKVDTKLQAEINTVGNHTVGFTGADAQPMTISRLMEAKVLAFGDKHSEAVALFAHSLQILDLITDAGTGFLKADANDPLFRVPGFRGRLLGMAVIESDSVTRVADINAKQVFRAMMIKDNAYGIMEAEEMEFEQDRDILAREDVLTVTQWYAVKAFHTKISADDKRIASATFQTRLAA